MLSTTLSKMDYIPFNKLFKISGRYSLNDDFYIDNFSEDNQLTAKIIDDCILTVLYSVGKPLFSDYKESMFKFMRSNDEYQDIEHYLYESGLNIKHIDLVGVQGKVSNQNFVKNW